VGRGGGEVVLCVGCFFFRGKGRGHHKRFKNHTSNHCAERSSTGTGCARKRFARWFRPSTVITRVTLDMDMHARDFVGGLYAWVGRGDMGWRGGCSCDVQPTSTESGLLGSHGDNDVSSVLSLRVGFVEQSEAYFSTTWPLVVIIRHAGCCQACLSDRPA
jgi:hypothetical protein